MTMRDVKLKGPACGIQRRRNWGGILAGLILVVAVEVHAVKNGFSEDYPYGDRRPQLSAGAEHFTANFMRMSQQWRRSGESSAGWPRRPDEESPKYRHLGVYKGSTALAMAIANAEEEDDDEDQKFEDDRKSEEDKKSEVNASPKVTKTVQSTMKAATSKCPVLWSGNSDCTQPVKTPAWCITPMQQVDASELFSLARARNRAQASSRTNGGSFAANLGKDRIHKGMRLDHFTFNKDNHWAVGIAGLRHSPLPPHDLPKMYDFSSCAVVGSSNSVFKSKKKMGAAIDRHSVVIRFNSAPTRGFEEWVGSKTTFRMQNPERTGFHEGSEVCLVRSYGIRSPGSCRKMSLSPQFNEYTKYHWAMYRKYGVKFERVNGLDRTKMSTGFMGVVLALHLCPKVDIYGFSQGDGYYFKHKKSSTNLKFSVRHPWGLEKQCLSKLTKLPEVTWHS